MKSAPKASKLELAPESEAWPRFEQFIRDVAKVKPQHKERKIAKATATAKNTK